MFSKSSPLWWKRSHPSPMVSLSEVTYLPPPTPSKVEVPGVEPLASLLLHPQCPRVSHDNLGLRKELN